MERWPWPGRGSDLSAHPLGRILGPGRLKHGLGMSDTQALQREAPRGGVTKQGGGVGGVL